MIFDIKLKPLIAIALLSSLSSFAQQSDNPASEAAADQVQHGFWKNPNVDYVAEDIPSSDKLLSVRDIPYLEKAFVETVPTNRKDGLVMGELGVDGGDKGVLAKLAQEMAEKEPNPINMIFQNT